MPETFALQVVKRVKDAAALAWWADFVPVQIKNLNQIRGEFDEVGGKAILGKKIEDRQKEKRFVRGAVGGDGRPHFPVFIGIEAGKALNVVFHCH